MSDIERARISKEAADAVVARPPRDDASGTAVRRYLGTALLETLRRRQAAVRKSAAGKSGASKSSASKPGPGTTGTPEEPERQP
jgi:hypothetical protein